MRQADEALEKLQKQLWEAYLKACRDHDRLRQNHAMVCAGALIRIGRLLAAFKKARRNATKAALEYGVVRTRLYFVFASLGLTRDDVCDPDATVVSLFWKRSKLRKRAEALGIRQDVPAPAKTEEAKIPDELPYEWM